MAKFSIRQLLMVIAVAAVCSLLIRTDWVAAIGFAAAIFYWTIAFKLFSDAACRRVNMVVRFIASLLAAVLIWFSVVDFSRSGDWCAHCGDHRFIGEYRICGIPVWATYGELHDSWLSRLREDLGFPCKHKFHRQHLVRAWGLLYCARPCIGVTCCLIGDPDYYSEDVSRLARQFASENPIEASALHKVIVEEMNYDAMHKFIIRLKEQTIRAER